VLEHLAIGAWVRFTEQFSTAPRLYEKIAGTPPMRRQQSYRTLLVELQKGRCFYCGGDGAAVDHVVPWSYVLEDRLWNLVLCCATCNGRKSDQTPTDAFIEKLLSRNQRLLDGDVPQVAARRDLQEWASPGLNEHVRLLVANCRADGFDTWESSLQLGS
jgi:hypothetical protein